MIRKSMALFVCLFLCASYSYAGDCEPGGIPDEYEAPGACSEETIEAEDSDSSYGYTDDDIKIVVCIFDAILNMIEEVETCHEEDTSCAVEAVFDMIISIIRCS